jgi:hypothetical protein
MSLGGSAGRTTVGWWRGIDDVGALGIQLPKTIDQRLRGRGTLTRGITDRMVPHQLCDACLGQQRSDGRQARLKRQIRPLSEIEDPLSRIRWRWIRIDQRPAAVKDMGAERPRYIDVLNVRRAERRHEEHELQIRHPGISEV